VKEVAMPTVPLPDDPDLDQLRKRARELQKAVREGDAQALAAAGEHHPDGVPADTGRAGWKLSAAQLVLARQHGFRSWAALRRHLDVVAEHSTAPDRTAASTDPATEFLRRACLTWSAADGPLQRSAAELLTPQIRRGDVWVAAACADVDEIARLLAADPTLATRPGGPHRWQPIAYLAFARHDPDLTEDAVVGTARLLLEHGADPNTGYLWHGMPSPFTLLTGAFGSGEQGMTAQPRHPQEHALARLLLRAGADPNDAQALYNRMFYPADDHLELLFEFGLGQGDGGPWRRRLGTQAQSPAEQLRGQLGWAVMHGFTHRVELLADHGVDLTAPLDIWGTAGRTPHEAALTTGHFEVATLLEQRGVPARALELEDQVLAAVLAADRPALDRLATADPGLVARARKRRPGLVVWAATRHDHAAVRLAVELGWDVSARARTDIPSDQEWETALHQAAATDDVPLARLLIDLGADPDVHDRRFDNTPLQWAHHFGHIAVAGFLEPRTGVDRGTTAPDG
jgi:Ankyrin repeats (many copies)